MKNSILTNMMTNSFTILLVLFTLNFSDILAQNIDTVTLQTSKGELEGSLYTPEHRDSFPVVLIIAGSGPTDRNGNNIQMVNNAYRMLADSLVKYGIGSMRYDKRGLGPDVEALIPEDKLRFQNFVNDAVDWIQLLDSMPAVTDIIVFGHSEGSLLGILAAQETPTDKLISLAGTGSPISEIIRKQLKDQPPKLTDMAYSILDSLEAGRKVDSISPVLYSLFRPSIQAYLLSWFQYDPTEEIQKLEIPVLIMHGTTDIQVDTTEAIKLGEGSPMAELVIIEGMNHIMKPAPAKRTENIQTYNDPNLPLHKDLIPPIVNFIKTSTDK